MTLRWQRGWSLRRDVIRCQGELNSYEEEDPGLGLFSDKDPFVKRGCKAVELMYELRKVIPRLADTPQREFRWVFVWNHLMLRLHRLGGHHFAHSGIVQPSVCKSKPGCTAFGYQPLSAHAAQSADTARSKHAASPCRVRAGYLPTHSRVAGRGCPSSRPGSAWHARDPDEGFHPLMSGLPLSS